jgi:streptogramin lyase
MLGPCTAANEGQVVFLTGTGPGTLQTCNGAHWVATACTTANIDQVVYVVSQATFEACTGTIWTSLPFSSTGTSVGSGNGPDSIAGTVVGPNGPIAGATVNLTGSANATGTTDANGHYAFTGLNNGSYDLSVSSGPSCSTATAAANNLTGIQTVNFTLTTIGNAGPCGSTAVTASTMPLSPGDPNCPNGGVALTITHGAMSSTSFVCNGAPGVSPAVHVPPGLVSEFALAGSARRLTAGPDGNVWFSDSTGFIGRVTPDGIANEFLIPTVLGASNAPASSDPNGITAGPDQKIHWVSTGNDGNGAIGQVSTTGTFSSAFLEPVGDDTSLAIDKNGNIWYGDELGNSIDRVSADGTTRVPFPFSTPLLPVIRDMTIGPDGNVWFTDNQNGLVGRVNTTSGTVSTFPLEQGAAPLGIAPGPDGNVWFCETNANAIVQITASGAMLAFTPPTANSAPSEITTGSDGKLWFTENAANQIGRFDPGTATFTEFALPASAAGPTAIAAGPDGNIWFIVGQTKIGIMTP